MDETGKSAHKWWYWAQKGHRVAQYHEMKEGRSVEKLPRGKV